jgi:hypothetical protein
MNKNSFTLTTLSENPEYFEEVIALIEKEFHYNSSLSYAKDFALLMDPLNFENCYLYVDQETNSVVSHLAVCTRTMIKNNHTMDVALIGGIATSAQYRGRDLFKNLMNHALTIHSAECGLFILWSEITGLYEKFSFHLSGGLIETGHAVFSASDRPMGFTKTSFKELSAKEFDNVQKLYKDFNQKYFFTVIREEKEWSIIKDMNSIDLYIKKNEAGAIEQYFCVNKGHDLTNIIHEVGCLPDQYLQMMKSLQKYRTWLPESELDLSSNKDIFFTAFMRLGNFKILKEFLTGVSNGQLELYEITGDLISFRFGTIEHQSSHKDFMQYLFGPRPLKEFESLMLSPYIPGTDSI